MATNLEFIKSASGTSVSSLSVTDCFSDKYDVYYVSITKTDVTVQTYSHIRFIDSVGSVISDLEYDYAELGLLSWTTFGENRATNQNLIGLINILGTSSAQGIGTGFYVFNPYDSSSYTFTLGQYAGAVSEGMAGGKNIGVHKSAEQITGINYLRTLGTFDNATVNVFGVK